MDLGGFLDIIEVSNSWEICEEEGEDDDIFVLQGLSASLKAFNDMGSREGLKERESVQLSNQMCLF